MSVPILESHGEVILLTIVLLLVFAYFSFLCGIRVYFWFKRPNKQKTNKRKTTKDSTNHTTRTERLLSNTDNTSSADTKPLKPLNTDELHERKNNGPKANDKKYDEQKYKGIEWKTDILNTSSVVFE